MFLHGWGLDHRCFLNFSKSLINYKCVLIDLYGFGNSEGRANLTLYDYAKGVEDILIENNLTNVTVLGHSFGGKIGLLLSTMSTRVKNLIIIDASGIKPRFSIKKFYLIHKYKLLKLLKLNTDNYGSEDYRALSEDMKSTFVNVVNTHLNKIVKNIVQDTLIIWGDKDKDTPLYMAHKLNRRIKNSSLIVLHGSHYAYAENSYSFFRILKAYLDGVYVCS